MSINLCEEVSCPFNGPGVVGCTKYTTSLWCPVLYQVPGKIRPGVECIPGSDTPWSQYWIVVADPARLPEFIAAHKEFLDSPEVKKRLEEDKLFSDEAE